MAPVNDNGVVQFPPLAVQATSIWKVLWLKFWVYVSPGVQPWAALSPTCIETVYESPSSQYGVSVVAMYPRERISALSGKLPLRKSQEHFHPPHTEDRVADEGPVVWCAVLLDPNADGLDEPSHVPEYENRGDESEMKTLVDMATTCPVCQCGLLETVYSVDAVQVRRTRVF